MKNTLSIRTVLRKDKMNQEGQCPIYLMINLNKKKFKLSTGHWIESNNWDFDLNAPKRKYPNLRRKLRLDVMNLEDFFLEKTARNEWLFFWIHLMVTLLGFSRVVYISYIDKRTTYLNLLELIILLLGSLVEGVIITSFFRGDKESS